MIKCLHIIYLFGINAQSYRSLYGINHSRSDPLQARSWFGDSRYCCSYLGDKFISWWKRSLLGHWHAESWRHAV